MNIKIAENMGKAAEKLIDVCAKGIGQLFNPWLIRRESKARADEMKTLAEAEAYRVAALADAHAIEIKTISDVIAETGSLETKYKAGPVTISIEPLADTNMEGINIQTRAVARLIHQESTGQANVEQVVAKTHALLKDVEPENVSDDPVDPDWINQYFGHIPRVSNDQMQGIWAKLLAGEIVRPGSFSLRTLEIVKKLSGSEARIFQDLCARRCYHRDSHHIFTSGGTRPWPKIDRPTLSFLHEAGLVPQGVQSGFAIGIGDAGPQVRRPWFKFPSGEILSADDLRQSATNAIASQLSNGIVLTKSAEEIASIFPAKRDEATSGLLAGWLAVYYDSVYLGDFDPHTQTVLDKLFWRNPIWSDLQAGLRWRMDV
jgi:hypothetical protein